MQTIKIAQDENSLRCYSCKVRNQGNFIHRPPKQPHTNGKPFREERRPAVQEIIKLVSTIRNDIEDLRSLLTHLSMTHAQRISEEWITADQVMQILKISVRTLKTLQSSGKLPYSKVNGLVYFRTADLENLLNDSYINPGSKDNDYVFKKK